MTAGGPWRVMVIDDIRSMFHALRQTLTQPEPSDVAAGAAAPAFELIPAYSGEPAVTSVRDALVDGHPFTVAFVALRTSGPDAHVDPDGPATIEQLWEADLDLHVVACVDGDAFPWAEVSARLGHNDRLLLLKSPFDAGELRQLTRALAERYAIMRSARFQLDESIVMWRQLRKANADLEREVTERKSVEERLRHNATHDALTGLPNRAYLMNHLERCVARARRHPEYLFAVFFLDLDNFKFVNDSLGHEVGDKLLVHVAQRIRSTLRASDLVTRTEGDTSARLGGDEFVVVLEGLEHANHAAVVADRLLRCLSESVVIQTNELTVNASIGITVSTHGYQRAEEVLRDADTAMYRAKQAGKSRFALFDPEMHAAAKRRLLLESELRRAIAEGLFTLVWQPIVDVFSGKLVALEALIRLTLASGERLSPGEFIGIAEETGLIVPIGEWVIEEACRSVAWLAPLWPEGQELRVNVNVSRRQLLDPRLPDTVQRALDKYGVAASCLGLEITESAVIDDVDAARHRLTELKAMGLSLYLDDFGIGYSSLSCLHQFPLDVVKIDRSFVASSMDTRSGLAIVNAIVSLSHAIGMKVTTEGIETAAQLAQIAAAGCDFAQGYLFSAPMTLESLQASNYLGVGRVS